MEKPALPETKEKALRQMTGPQGANPQPQAMCERPAHIEGHKQIGDWEFLKKYVNYKLNGCICITIIKV